MRDTYPGNLGCEYFHMKKIVFLLSITLYIHAFADNIETIRISEAAWHHDSMELIALVLDATIHKYGPYEIKIKKNAVQARAIVEIANRRELDMIWFATSIDREKILLPIRIPIDMGLLGYRVCAIKEGTQERFKGVKDLQSWHDKKLTIGQGFHWPDTSILQANNLTVIPSYTYENLFVMARRGRFDCFARSIIEILDESRKSSYTGLTIEKTLLFTYPMPTFIFVNRDNTMLAERISYGLKATREDGTFQEYMASKRLNALKNLNVHKRHIIKLKNPYLSKETQLMMKKKSLWQDHEALNTMNNQ